MKGKEGGTRLRSNSRRVIVCAREFSVFYRRLLHYLSKAALKCSGHRIRTLDRSVIADSC